MATIPPSEAVVPAPVIHPAEREIIVYSHSSLFYWWPVWAVGYLMFALTIVGGYRMTVVPHNTERIHIADLPNDQLDRDGKLKLHMTDSKNLGVFYATVLLIIIVISNVPLRGLWSVIIILAIVLFIVIMALAEWWRALVDAISLLDIRINAGGYFFISTVLFIIWTLTVFVFDRRTYLAVKPGQVRLCTAIGAAETVQETSGITFQKRQDDLFRHWIVGLGSGDLIIHRANANVPDIDMPNVLFIGSKIKEIERLTREKEVV